MNYQDEILLTGTQPRELEQAIFDERYKLLGLTEGWQYFLVMFTIVVVPIFIMHDLGLLK